MHFDLTAIGLLAASFLALLVGPAIHHLSRASTPLLAALDGFVVVAIGGLVLVHVIPDSLGVAGWPALVAATVGLVLPGLVERWFHWMRRGAFAAGFAFVLVGLAVHAFLDGAGLASGHDDGEGNLLGMAVVLHRLPVGLTIWMLVRPSQGVRVALGVIAVEVAGTLVGFFSGEAAVAQLTSAPVAVFQALVAGSLLHVIIDHGHRVLPDRDPKKWSPQAAIGALVGGAVVALLSLGGHEHGHGGHEAEGLGHTFVALALESAPALFLGYLGAGLISAFLPKATVGWMSRGGHASRALRGMAFGLPLPVCSCGVVPLYRTLVVQGVPAASAMAFLVATPELGIDAVLLSVPLLGTPMAIARVVAAALVALLVGWVVGRLVPDRPRLEPRTGGLAPEDRRLSARLRRVVQMGFREVFDDTAPWVLLGLLVAAVAEPLVHGGWLADVPELVQVPLFALLGLPMYICASGATPFVAVLVAEGASPGAALAFLLTGPATNVTTFGLLASLHGRRIAAIFAIVIGIASVALGFTANALLPRGVPDALHALGEDPASVLQVGAVVVLGLALLFALFRNGPRHIVEQVLSLHAHSEDAHCADKSCAHCHPADLAPAATGCGCGGHDHDHDHDHDHGHGHSHDHGHEHDHDHG